MAGWILLVVLELIKLQYWISLNCSTDISVVLSSAPRSHNCETLADGWLAGRREKEEKLWPSSSQSASRELTESGAEPGVQWDLSSPQPQPSLPSQSIKYQHQPPHSMPPGRLTGANYHSKVPQTTKQPDDKYSFMKITILNKLIIIMIWHSTIIFYLY